MTEEELNLLRQKARTGDAKAECELALAYSGDYFKFRAIYTLRALYKEVLAALIRLINEKCQSDASARLAEQVEAFRQSPSRASVESLIAAIILDSNTYDVTNSWKVIQGLSEAMGQISATLCDLMDEHFPEWHKRENLCDAVIVFSESPDTETLTALISALNATAKEKGNEKLIVKLLADAACKGYHPALEKLAEKHGLWVDNIVLEGDYVRPVLSSEGNVGCSLVVTGQYYPDIKVRDRVIRIPRTLSLLSMSGDTRNRFVLVSHDGNSHFSRKDSTQCTLALLASIMAWVGPHGFTIDVVDFENSGIGAPLTPFLPAKKVKVLAKAEEWGRELETLTNLMSKRTAQFSNFIEYNREHLDMKEQLKVVVVQDLSGSLMEAWEKPKKEECPEQEDIAAYKEHQKQVEEFSHLLERGFQFGIIFIVNTSKPAVYPRTDFQVDCTSNIAMIENPFDCIRIEGVEAKEKNWLLRHLADGKSPTFRKQQTASAADGILKTEVSEENPDAVFQLDTVSHTHAFIIGKTGSGKSVLLHNILIGLTTRYSPEDLMLYLLDLKMGGVEFNRYRSLPHLRSLLVDNSDIQIVQEIMRDIEQMMRERGKAFRDAGVSNVKEYNKAHSETKMAQVLVVIDECHQIFTMGEGSNSTKEQNAITARLAKIAKEGRSQGIHLLFATQTLSGSGIPADIQKNITDYYLLKCDQGDANRLVDRIGDMTKDLPVGKVYYHHTDKQMFFQGTYIESDECKRIINETAEQNKGKISHGQFYFNGSQTFQLDEKAIASLTNGNGEDLCGAVGRKINLLQDIVSLNLTADYAQNILSTGINSEGQLDRTTMALLASQLLAAQASNVPVKIFVIDCSPKGAEVSNYLGAMANKGWISLCKASESEHMLKELCKQVQQQMVFTPTMLYIIGQDRFGEMKRDLAFSDDAPMDVASDVIDASDIFAGIAFASTSEEKANFKSYREAVRYLLDSGPSAGLHTLIQIEKTANLLFEDFISNKLVSANFKHLLLLRSDDKVATQLGIDDSLKLSMLSADPDRLRAYYYNEDSGEAVLFSPFEQIEINNIETIINSLTQ